MRIGDNPAAYQGTSSTRETINETTVTRIRCRRGSVCHGSLRPAQAKTYNMKIGMVTINDSNHFSANWMKKEIEAKSNGRIKVGVFPAAQLGKIPRQIEAIQLGTQEVFMIPPGFFIGIDKRFMVTDAPACSKMKIMRPGPLIIPISLMYFHKSERKKASL